MLHKLRSEQLSAVNAMDVRTGLEPQEDGRNSSDSQGLYVLQLKVRAYFSITLWGLTKNIVDSEAGFLSGLEVPP